VKSVKPRARKVGSPQVSVTTLPVVRSAISTQNKIDSNGSYDATKPLYYSVVYRINMTHKCINSSTLVMNFINHINLIYH